MMRFFMQVIIIIFSAFNLCNFTAGQMNVEQPTDSGYKPKAPSRQDYQEIKKMFPKAKRIQSIAFKEKFYYILVRNKKINRILSAWETGTEKQIIWLAFNQAGELLEIIYYPQLKKLSMKKNIVKINEKKSSNTILLINTVKEMQQDFSSNRQAFIRKIKLNIHKIDAVSQATP